MLVGKHCTSRYKHKILTLIRPISPLTTILKNMTLKLGHLTNFKVLFPAMSMDSWYLPYMYIKIENYHKIVKENCLIFNGQTFSWHKNYDNCLSLYLGILRTCLRLEYLGQTSHPGENNYTPSCFSVHKWEETGLHCQLYWVLVSL